MSPAVIAAIILCLLWLAILIGHQFAGDEFSAEAKDTIKLAMGLIATMSALLLGLLVTSAKETYDSERTQVIQMTAKVAYLDRVLSVYGPEAAGARKAFRAAIADAVSRLWPADKHVSADLKPNEEAGDSFFFKIEELVPSSEMQTKLKSMAEATATDLAQSRALLVAQSQTAISTPMLCVVVSWLVIIFGAFSVLSPPHFGANTALVISAIAVSGAIFLLLELDQPFTGIIQIPNQQLVEAMKHLPN